MNVPIEAICSKGRLHEFNDVTEYPDAFVEICTRCSSKAIYHKDEQGRMDNRRYLRSHYRSFVQPFGVTGKHFAMVWGERAWRQAIEKKEVKLPVDWQQAGEDARKMLRQLQKEQAVI